MKHIFTSSTRHSIKNTVCPDYLKKLPEAILKHTDWDYSYEQTDSGCFLKPTFQNMPYRNSFVPEIDIVVSENNNQAILLITGSPVKAVRVFYICVCTFLLIIEVSLLLSFITSGIKSIFPLFIPIGIIVLNFLILKIGTRITFNSIVKAIRNELT